MRVVSSHTISYEAQMKLKLLAMARHKTMSKLLEEMITEMWEKAGEELAVLPTQKAKRYIQRQLERVVERP